MSPSHVPVRARTRMAPIPKLLFSLCGAVLVFYGAASAGRAADALVVGAAAVELEADDAMVIAGGITGGNVSGQEGKLRCVATVIGLGTNRVALVACDVLMLTRRTLDPVINEIERTL